MSNDLWKLTAVQAVALLKKREITSLDLIEASARRIAVFLFTLLGFQREAMSSFTCSSGPLFTPRRLDLPCCIPLLE